MDIPHQNRFQTLAEQPIENEGGANYEETPSPIVIAHNDVDWLEIDEIFQENCSEEFESTLKSPCRTKVVFQCTWPGCGQQYQECDQVERHVRTQHLKRGGEALDSEGSDHEEEFYYTEMEVESPLSPFLQGSIYSSSVPTLSHLDMARPAHEDPEYKKQTQVLGPTVVQASPISIPQLQKSAAWHLHGYAASAPSNMGSPQKCMRLSIKPTSSPSKSSSPLHRRTRSESRKCRKVYGMENRDMWCTQCKWKKSLYSVCRLKTPRDAVFRHHLREYLFF
ncbi:zinc finger protein 395-like [Stegodyphus dumicola]|uniref:zinc finger protein 395-like n=1 Tax=Stegodyphus dumicola TaxID=202533 RepID=UPI0015B20FE3|nr:zinc finger protein 395-like [Stegodyphus dumicola]